MFKIHISLLLNLFKASGPFQIQDFHVCLPLLSSNELESHTQLILYRTTGSPMLILRTLQDETYLQKQYKSWTTGFGQHLMSYYLRYLRGPIFLTVAVKLSSMLLYRHYKDWVSFFWWCATAAWKKYMYTDSSKDYQLRLLHFISYKRPHSAFRVFFF